MSDQPAVPIGCAAIFVVRDIAASLVYYEQKLGFEIAFEYGEPTFYAGVCRGAVTIHLQDASKATRPAGASALSVFVGDADAAHEELVERGVAIGLPPTDRPYGLRDFDLEDPDGNRLIFGSEIGSAP